MAASPHKRLPIFIDHNSGGRSFREFLVKHGIKVVLFAAHYGKAKVDDHEWLVEIGDLGWPIITGDARVRKNANFLRSIQCSKARVFILHDLNGKSPKGKADCIMAAHPRILELIEQSEPPVIWTFKENVATEFDWRTTVARWKAYGRI